jgi:hypothetical protein
VAEEIYLLSNNDETGNEDDVRTNWLNGAVSLIFTSMTGKWH